MMGGPIDARKSPTAVNNLAMNKSYEWFENNVIYRVPQNYPGAGRRVYPGFLQHTGFVAMNPDRHLSLALRLLPRPGARRRGQRRRAPPLLRRVQRRARHAGRVLPRHHQDGVPGLRAGQRHLGRRRRAGAAAGHHHHRAADDRRRARRHLRRRPDPRGARPVHRHPEAIASSTTTCRAPATTASSPAGAGARRSTRRCAHFIERFSEARRRRSMRRRARSHGGRRDNGARVRRRAERFPS